jgi:hypothetical protein
MVSVGQRKPSGATAVTTLEIAWLVLLLTSIVDLMALLVDWRLWR